MGGHQPALLCGGLGFKYQSVVKIFSFGILWFSSVSTGVYRDDNLYKGAQ